MGFLSELNGREKEKSSLLVRKLVELALLSEEKALLARFVHVWWEK